MVRWDQLCAAILSTPGTQSPRATGLRLRRNGRVGFSFLVYTISKNALNRQVVKFLLDPTITLKTKPAPHPILLPKELHSKLNLARSCGRAADRARGAGNTCRCEHDEIWRIEIGSIQQVKDLPSKLQG